MTDKEADSSLEEELIKHYYDDLPSPSTIRVAYVEVQMEVS